MWIKPAREQPMGRASDFLEKRLATPYLTTGATTGSDAYFTPDLYSNVVASLPERFRCARS